MPLPNKSDLQKLDIVYLGRPFVEVEATNLNTKTMDVVYLGRPFVVAASGFNVYVLVSGVWKAASAIYVKVSGVWKAATNVYVKAAGIWKS